MTTKDRNWLVELSLDWFAALSARAVYLIARKRKRPRRYQLLLLFFIICGLLTIDHGLIHAGQLLFDGVPVDITTSSDEDLVITPGGGGNTQIGDASGTNSNATSNDDLHITGKLETDGAAYFDSSVKLGDATSDSITAPGYFGSDVIPATDSTYDLGSSSLTWQYVYADVISGYNDNLALNPAPGQSLTGSVTKNAATGNEIAYDLAATVNKATSGNYTGLKLNVTETSAPGAADKLLDLQVGGTSRVQVYNGANSANYGLLCVGTDDWDGATGGCFAGDANGTQLAVNAITGFAGNLIDAQVAGSSKFSVDENGNVTAAGTISGAGGTNLTGTTANTFTINSDGTATTSELALGAAGSTGGKISTGAGNLTIDSTGGTIDIDDGAIDLSTQTVDVTLNAAADALNFDSDTLTIDAANNRVGIGTTGPTSPLHIDPAAQATTSPTFTRTFVDNSNAITTNTGNTAVHGLMIDEPNITVGTATPANAASLYISGAPTEATSNYAIWVDDGAVQLDGALTVGGIITGTVSGGSAVTGTTANTFTINSDGTATTSELALGAAGSTGGKISTGAGNLTIDSTGGTIDIDDGAIDLSTQTVDVTLNAAADALNFDSDTLCIDALANVVGIGTASPYTGCGLTIQRNGDTLRLQDPNNGGHNYIEWYSNGAAQARTAYFGYGSNGSTDFTLVTTRGGSSDIVLDPENGVGIDLAGPLGKLAVFGAICANYQDANFPNIRGTINHYGNSGGLAIAAQGANNSTAGSGDIIFQNPETNSADASTDAALTTHMVIKYNGNVGIGTTSPDRLLHPELSDATANAVTYPLRLTHVTTGTPANNIGAGLEFEVETSANNNEIGAIIEAVATDATATSEDFDIVFKNMAAGAAAAETARVTSASGVELPEISAPSGNPSANKGWLYVKDNSGTSDLYFEDDAGTVTELTAGGSGDITAVGSMTSGDAFAGTGADDDWLGLGAAAGRIAFDDQATDYVNILDANVGIGTAGPSSGKLQIEGTSAPTTFSLLRIIDAGRFPLTIESTESGPSSQYIELYRNSSSPASNDILGSVLYSGNDSGANKTTYSYFGAKIGDATDGSEDGTFFINTIINGTETDVLTINSGNVGIGTTSPDRLLHPELSDATANAATYPLRLTHVTTGTPANNIGAGLEFEVETSANNNELGAIIEAVATDTTATSEDFDIVFKNMAAGAAAAETFRIDSQGNVTAQGTITGTISGYVKTDGSTPMTADWDLGDGLMLQTDKVRARDAAGLSLFEDGGTGIFIEDGGEVGIGTTSPASALHVIGDIRGTTQIVLTGIGGFDSNATGVTGAEFYSVNTPLKFSANASGNNHMVISTTGNVGIGTTSPDRLLHPELSDATANAATYPLRLTHVTTGTPANNIGAGLEFEVETSANNNEVGASIEAVASDTTATSEDFDIVFKNMAAGAAIAETARVTSASGLELPEISAPSGNPSANKGWLYVKDNGGASDLYFEDDAGTVTELTAGGSGDITSVGDVTSGAAFDGTQGTSLTFNNAGGDGILSYDGTDFDMDKPATIATSVTTPTLIGGTATTSDLNLKTTSGVGATGADMHFLVGSNGGTEAMTILNDGNVGIGTTGPGKKFVVSGLSSDDAVSAFFDRYGGANGGTLIGRNARGTEAAPTATQANDNLLFFGGRGYGATGFSNSSRAGIGAYASQAFTDTAQGTYLVFYTTDDGTTTMDERVRITNSGDVGIGTTPGAKLEVAGVTSGNAFKVSGGAPSYTTQNVSVNEYGTLSSVGITNSAMNGLFGAMGVGDTWNRIVFGLDWGTPFLGFGPGSSTRDVFITRSTTNTFRISSDGSTGSADLIINGNVGIGTTSPGAYKLHVEGAMIAQSYATGDILFRATDDGPDIWKMFEDEHSLFTESLTTGQTVLTIKDNGNVGIGTTGPTALLHLDGAAGTVTFEANSDETTATNNVLMLRSDVTATDDAVFRVQANGATYADGAYTGTGADYAEWFEKEGELAPKDVVGLNLATGKVRKYQVGDMLVGVYSQKPGFVGNQPLEKTEKEMEGNHALVSLIGQVDVATEQIHVENGRIYTQDGIQLGYRLANGRVLLRI